MRRSDLVLAGVLLAQALPAQAEPARRLRSQQAAQAVGTPAWFLSGFELVEAEFACDVAGAVEDSRRLLEHREQATGDLSAVAAAMHQLAVALLEGPARAPADAEHEVHAAPDDRAASGLRARWLVTRARLRWLRNEPTEFLLPAFTALEAARASGDDALRLRTIWTLHGALEREVPDFDATLFEEAESRLAAPALAGFRPWHALNRHWLTTGSRTREERERSIDEIVRQADAIGDLRTRVHAEWDRAVSAMAAEQFAAADAAVDTAAALCRRLGDRRLQTISLELAAEFALEHDRFDVAAARLQEAAAMSAERGFPDRDVQQAHLRLRLATNHEDDEAMAVQTRRLDELRRAENARYRGYRELRDQLLSGERRRLTTLREQRATIARLQFAAGLGIGGALVAIAVVAWIGRRRLQQANRELQLEMARTAAANEARHLLEQRLQAVERADGLGTLANGMAHGFNNLIAAVLGNAELLRDETDPAERARLVATIQTAGQRAAELCRQLQSCAVAPNPALAAVDLAALVRRVAPTLAAALGPEIELQLDVATAPQPMRADAAEIEQAVMHLAANARDAGARRVQLRGRQVTMPAPPWSAAHVHGEARAGDFACLEIADDGPGIEPAHAERIFEPFFTTRFAGRGMGLAVVAGIVRRHQGVITVDSAVGEGTTFRLLLPPAPTAPARDPVLIPAPLRPAPAAAGPAEPTAPDDGPRPGMAVLLVEDEAPVREFLTIALRRRGHHPVMVDSGGAVDAALQELPSAGASVALVDLMMPGIDGREVVRRIRTARPDVAIVLMSGNAREQLEDRARELATEGCIAKPFRSIDVERELARAIARHHAARTN